MFTMFIYGISILFTPGPVTLLSVSQGFQKKFKHTLAFCTGVGLATFLLFIIYGYTGSRLIKEEHLTYIGALGSIYILYLSIKIFRHQVSFDDASSSKDTLNFRDGFFMQFFNPKASLVALPVATINFPANGITGTGILIVSSAFLLMGIASPALYCYSGQYLSRFIRDTRMLNLFNKAMAIVLAYVAASIFYEHVLH